MGYAFFANSVRAFAAQDPAQALGWAQQAHAAAPDELLYADAVQYLTQVQQQTGPGVYAQGDAFSAFIGGGGNLPLYDSARERLGEWLRAHPPTSLLDIGTGEGSIIVPVAATLHPAPRLTFCEPSLALLERARHLAAVHGLTPEAYPLPLEAFLSSVSGRWDTAVATWSLHNLPPAHRAPALAALAGRVRSLCVAEFDDPSGQFDDPLDPARIRHIHDRYRLGLREYPGEAGRLVRLGFLLPVLYGYFAREGQRSTHEQPITRWEAELTQAGFAVTQRILLYPYWWADAYLLIGEAVG